MINNLLIFSMSAISIIYTWFAEIYYTLQLSIISIFYQYECNYVCECISGTVSI